MENNPKFVLLDSNAIIHRAYHGLPPLTTKSGELVNAVYGFTTTLFKTIEDFHPKYIAACFDVKGPTVRHEQFKEYKAHRPPAPEELIKQFAIVKEICKVLNIPIFAVSGYEADDLIGTITQKLEDDAKGLKIIIVTGDMDTLQLVSDNTSVYSMSRGIKNAEIYNEKKVREKYGFGPELLIDYKALRGDPSDNIPGVPGIGEKTAKKIIEQFNSIENLYKKLLITNNQLSTKTKELLIKYKDQAFLSKKLATIIQNVPIDFDLSGCLVHDYNKNKAEKFFRTLDFNSLIKRLPEVRPNQKQDKLF